MPAYIKALKGIINFSKSNHYNKIQTIKEQLVGLGYQPSEVEYFVKNFAGINDLSRLDEAELQQLSKKLQHQLEIARKCREMIKDLNN